MTSRSPHAQSISPSFSSLSLDETDTFKTVQPWPIPDRADCMFYHSFDFPDGEATTGHWDIRGRFDQYIGHYPLAGKTVLDVGTASGFLAFSAEVIGARVTAVEARHAAELDRIPLFASLYHHDRSRWAVHAEKRLTELKSGFWYAWHKFKSDVEVVYAPLDCFPLWERRFDVVLAGAIVEHLADPVSAIGAIARLANEAVIIAFTDVGDSEELFMQAMNNWSNPALDYTWWMLSRGLYRRVFENIGFSIEIVKATAVCNEFETPSEVFRPTVIARRVR